MPGLEQECHQTCSVEIMSLFGYTKRVKSSAVHSDRIILYLKILIVAIPVTLLLWLGNQRYIFTPTITLNYRAGTAPGPINPELRDFVRSLGSGWRLNDDLLKFTVRIPRLVESVRLRLTLRNTNQPVILLTAKGPPDIGNISLIVRNRMLDTLAWPQRRNAQLTLWQRPSRSIPSDDPAADPATLPTVPVQQYASVQDFIEHQPPTTNFATVGVNSLLFTRPENYQPASLPITMAHTFRGQHTIYVYAADEDLRFGFDKVDLNFQPDLDPLTVTVRRLAYDPTEKTLLLRKSLPDDGNATADHRLGPNQHLDVVLPQVKPGMYKIQIDATDDVSFKNLVSDQHYLGFAGRVFLAEGPAYPPLLSFRPLDFQTNGHALSIRTKHVEGLQDFVINNQEQNLLSTGDKLVFSNLLQPTTFAITKPDLIITGDGLLAIAPALLPPPAPDDLLRNGDNSLESYDYLIGNYQPQATMGRIQYERTFPVTKLLLTDHDLHFQLEMPGLVSGRRTFAVDRISATLRRGPFQWQKIGAKLHLTQP